MEVALIVPIKSTNTMQMQSIAVIVGAVAMAPALIVPIINISMAVTANTAFIVVPPRWGLAPIVLIKGMKGEKSQAPGFSAKPKSPINLILPAGS